MFRGWTFGQRLAAGFGIGAATLLVVAALGFQTNSMLTQNTRSVTHTYQVQKTLTELTADIIDAETGERGYIITGDDDYLTPYRAALARVHDDFHRAQQLTTDNPSQQRRFAALSPLVDRRLAELKTGVDTRRNVGMQPAVKVVLTNLGLQTMLQIRAVIADAIAEEDRLLAVRAANTKAAAQLATAISLWGGLLGAILVLGIGWFMARSLSGQIGQAVSRLQNSSTELQAAATQQATGAKEQSTATSEITTTISELLATSRQIAESAQSVAQLAEQTASASRSGHGTVEQAGETIAGIRRQVDQIVADMLDLGKKSQEVGAVLEIVSELAEQTNILAINATIEATGAGEAGLRFGVVADEIRKLADRVGGSTKEIRSLIDDVRSAVNTTIMATETGAKTVEAGAKQYAEVAEAFTEISGLVATAAEAAREIELSTKQQATAVEQVNVAIVNVAQASKETETSSGQTLTTAAQLASLSGDISKIVLRKAA
ncbi:MAG: CHASE3 domain-containing protein [Caulobacteraceae bacterium]|nr:CHASE3 domain-containing protein [Caulobacteraceae bacterium]